MAESASWVAIILWPPGSRFGRPSVSVDIMDSQVPYIGMTRRNQSVEVRKKGRWVTIPAIEVNGDLIIATGKRLKIAKIRGEEMREKQIDDPELYIAALTNDTGHTLNADIFTF